MLLDDKGDVTKGRVDPPVINDALIGACSGAWSSQSGKSGKRGSLHSSLKLSASRTLLGLEQCLKMLDKQREWR